MNVLILVDIQNDFLPGGALAVPEGDRIIPLVNSILPKFKRIIATQDWHPRDHGSFAANHPGKSPGDEIELHGLPQVLWPVHCVQQTKGAEFSDQFDVSRVEKVFVKGTDKNIDSYSGFYDNGHRKSTGLADYLHQTGTNELTIAGLATDYCVKFTALDAIREGFRTTVVEDATRAVNLQEHDFEKSIREMKDARVNIISSGEILS